MEWSEGTNEPMYPPKTYILVSHLMIAAGLLSLTVAGGMAGFVIIGSSVCAVSAYFVEMKGRFSLRPSEAASLTILAIIYSIFDVAAISNSTLVGFSHFLILLQSIKLLQRKKDKDYLQLFLISFIQLVISSAMATSLFYALPFIIYLLLATWAITMFHFKREGERSSASTGPHHQIPPSAFTGRFFAGVSLLALSVFALTLALFIIFPRVGLGLMSGIRDVSVMISGFSSRVSLGDIGRIKLSPRVVMRVEVEEGGRPRGGDLLLRGVALDRYSNGNWSTYHGKDRYINAEEDGTAHLTGGTREDTGGLTESKITLEAADSMVLFHPPGIVKVEGKFRWLRVDGNGAIYFTRPYTEGAQYSVFSKSSGASEGDPPSGEVGPVYLQLGTISGRATALAAEITKGVDDPYEAAGLIERYLLANYKYSLDQHRTPGAEPVEDFLFYRRAGHCEYFASAMVLMLRAIEIPARLVNGFRGGEWNETGRYYVVRERNAHSWVEAFIPERGWVTFDPTPPDPYPSSFMPGALNFLPRFLDSLRLKWYKYVIDFDTYSQRKMLTDLDAWLSSGKANLIDQWSSARGKARGMLPALRSSRRALPVVVIASLIGVLVILRNDLRLHIRRGTKGRGVRTPEVKFYKELLSILNRRGHLREPSVTPLEHAESVLREEGEAFAGVIPLTDIYYRVRFGRALLTKAERDEIKSILSALKGRGSGGRIS